MNKSKLISRTKFFPASEKRISESKTNLTTRRNPNFVDMSELNTDNVVSDFFEFEKEISQLKASNKISEIKNE